jgi:uncharacterized protein YkwD
MPSNTRCRLTLAASLLLLLAGCLTTPQATESDGGSGPTPAGGSGAGGVDSTTSGNGPDGSDAVGSFPDCLEPVDAVAWRAEVLTLVNDERAAVGLDALVRNQTLEEEADEYACEMIHYNFFAHVNPVTGTTLADRTEAIGYDYVLVGENLAAGLDTPQQVVQAWMDSPGHRANILEPQFTELGVGVRGGGAHGTYWVQEFGRSR